MTPRIDELTGLAVIGRFYLVPTVQYPWFGRMADWPVIGPRHEDAKIIKFECQHYHVDGRFLSTRQMAFVRTKAFARNETTEGIFASRPLAYRSQTREKSDPHPAPVLKRLKYQRTIKYPVAVAEQHWLPQLRAAYNGTALSKNAAGVWVCPHRGAPLGGVTPDEFGIITCPLHGLQWCASTGLPA